MIDRRYCKHCDKNFVGKVPTDGDFLFVCPHCGAKHYRHIENGDIVHADIQLRKNYPIEILGKAIGAR
jgi:Zn finger protein HypA/HybF involved in hydrogenase expression